MKAWGVGVEWLLRAVAVLSAATCLVWVLGAMGTGLLYSGPEPVGTAAQSFNLEAAAGYPSLLVDPDEAVFMEIIDVDAGFNSSDGLGVPGGFAQYYFPYFHVTTYEPTLLQRLAYVGLQCLLSLGIAWLWWSLAGAVASSRRGDPFTSENASRLRLLGLVLAVGGPTYAVGMWLVHRWLLDTSEVADEVVLIALSWRDVPWWSVAAGLALLVLAGVWRRGVAMRHELAGLV